MRASRPLPFDTLRAVSEVEPSRERLAPARQQPPRAGRMRAVGRGKPRPYKCPNSRRGQDARGTAGEPPALRLLPPVVSLSLRVSAPIRLMESRPGLW